MSETLGWRSNTTEMEEEEESGEKVGTGAGRGGEKLIHLRDK
jgi:hypothetical protein